MAYLALHPEAAHSLKQMLDDGVINEQQHQAAIASLIAAPVLPSATPQFSSAHMKKARLAHFFTTGWEIGWIKGREASQGEHFGQFFVKYKTERDYLYHDLNSADYGTSAGKLWVLLK